MATVSDAWKALWNDPLGSLAVLFSSGVPVDGKPSLTGGAFDFGFGAPVDSIVSAQQRAYGVEPFTGELIAPQYATAAANAGRDPANPQAFLDKVRGDALGFYNAQFAKNSSEGDNKSSGASWAVPLLVILVLVLILLKVVK